MRAAAPIASLGCLFSLCNAAALSTPGKAILNRPVCLNEAAGTTSEQQLALPNHFLSRQAANATLPDSIALDVHFHLASSTVNATIITDDVVAAQFAVLHDAYAKYDITLTLSSVDRIVDDLTAKRFFAQDPDTGEWIDHQDLYLAYVKSTRKGGYDALNLYFFTEYLPGATGYCTWPTPGVVEGSDTFWLDSCQLSARTMPGLPADRQFEEWNLGHMAVHESGHWFGLNHTFAGGCGGTGDFVDDTPAQGVVYGCPAGEDTCPGVAGLDPIHNYMGYTDDSCTNEFTPGQKARMFDRFYNVRAPK